MNQKQMDVLLHLKKELERLSNRDELNRIISSNMKYGSAGTSIVTNSIGEWATEQLKLVNEALEK